VRERGRDSHVHNLDLIISKIPNALRLSRSTMTPGHPFHRCPDEEGRDEKRGWHQLLAIGKFIDMSTFSSYFFEGHTYGVGLIILCNIFMPECHKTVLIVN
jgi:hypothetical protein